MAKSPKTPKSKVEPAEQLADAVGPRPLVPVTQQVTVCAECAKALSKDGTVLPLAPAPKPVPHPAVSCAAITLLFGLAVLIPLGDLSAELYWHILLVVIIGVFVVPVGLDKIEPLLKRILR